MGEGGHQSWVKNLFFTIARDCHQAYSIYLCFWFWYVTIFTT